MTSEFFDINELIEDARNNSNLFVIFSQRGAGKNAITKLLTAVGFIEQIYKTTISVYRDENYKNNMILSGLVGGVEIKLVIEMMAYNLSLNDFVYRVAHKFTEAVEDELFKQTIKMKGE